MIEIRSLLKSQEHGLAVANVQPVTTITSTKKLRRARLRPPKSLQYKVTMEYFTQAMARHHPKSSIKCP